MSGMVPKHARVEVRDYVLLAHIYIVLDKLREEK